MNPFSQALQEGYTEEEVFNFISNAFPNIRNKIQKAVGSGYSVKEILKFLSNLTESNQKPSNVRTSQQAGHAEQMRADERRLQQVLKTGLSLGAGALVGRAALQNLPKLSGALRGLPKSAPTSPPPIPPLENALNASRLKDLKQDLFSFRIAPKIEQLAAKNPIDAIPGMLQKQLTDDQREYLTKKFGKPVEDLIKDYAELYLQKAEEKPFSREGVSQQFESGIQDETIQAPEEGMPQAQSQKMAILPDGSMGKIVEERQGIGSIELPNGQIRNRKMSELDIEPPELEKQITDLISSIPEEERSAVLAFASYNPGQEFEFDGKKHQIPFMGVQFHNGDFYLYPGVSKDQFDKVVSKAVKAKTTGENPWHAWTAGKESRGAGMYELIRELEKEFGKNFIKLKAGEGYDYFKRIREIVKKVEREKRRKTPKVY